ncbi:hypothetical protein BGW37DRAFT_493811 [Umbelopsis sp. PMI_123]|nr:hypothetical protein BGW37DRAFT_493811 [Umbelopsis sp. PMI_123]
MTMMGMMLLLLLQWRGTILFKWKYHRYNQANIIQIQKRHLLSLLDTMILIMLKPEAVFNCDGAQHHFAVSEMRILQTNVSLLSYRKSVFFNLACYTA